ncbi:MAG: hypothetical protein ACXVY3_02845 [Gaiellaceae bacterium]
MGLAEEIAEIAVVAGTFAEADETLAGIVAAEPAVGSRLYLCAYAGKDEGRSWLGLDADGRPLADRDAVREGVSIAALCELAEETAAGGDVRQLLARIGEIRATDPSVDLETTETAARALASVVEPLPRIATPAYLDRLGAAARDLEQALGGAASSPFALALQQGMPAIEALIDDVERGYKGTLG